MVEYVSELSLAIAQAPAPSGAVCYNPLTDGGYEREYGASLAAHRIERHTIGGKRADRGRRAEYVSKVMERFLAGKHSQLAGLLKNIATEQWDSAESMVSIRHHYVGQYDRHGNLVGLETRRTHGAPEGYESHLLRDQIERLIWQYIEPWAGLLPLDEMPLIINSYDEAETSLTYGEAVNEGYLAAHEYGVDLTAGFMIALMEHPRDIETVPYYED